MSKKDLIEQNITRVQEYVRELIEDAKWNNGVSETLESTSIIVGNSDDIYDFAILFASAVVFRISKQPKITRNIQA